jgi:hypothetical protein
MALKALTGRLPHYLVELLTRCPNKNLRSNQTKLALPQTKDKFLQKELVVYIGLRSCETNF